MPPINLPGLNRGLSALRGTSALRLGATRRGLTQSQRELLPFIRAEEEKRERRRNLLAPVEAVFDVLQRPQFASANIAQEFIRLLRGEEDVDIGGAALRGITGKEKGRFENVLFGGQSPGGEEFEGLFPIEDVKGGGRQFTRKAGGFLGDVILDPLTWVGVGPTRAALAAAQQFAKRSVSQAFARAGNLGRLRSIVPDIAEDVSRIAKTDPQRAADLLRSKGGVDFAREMDRLYDDALREAGRLTPQGAQTKFLGNLKEESDAVVARALDIAEDFRTHRSQYLNGKIREAVTARRKPQADKLRAELAKIETPEWLKGLRDRINRRISGQDVPLPSWVARRVEKTRAGRLASIEAEVTATAAPAFAESLRGLGERASKVFGQELGAHTRGPNFVARQFQDLASQFRKTQPGQKFTDAWWAIINRGPIGVVRKALGFRNHYQRMLREMELENRAGLQMDVEVDTKKTMDAIGGADDQLLGKYFQAVSAAEAAGPETLFGDALSPEVLARIGILPQEREGILELASRIKTVTDEWAREFQQWHAAGYVKDLRIIENYLPAYMKETGVFKRAGKQRGTPNPQFSRTRTFGLEETTAQEVAKLRLLMGVDEDAARQMVIAGASVQVTNVRELLAARAIAQAKVRSRVNLVDRFREFGVNLNEIRPRAAFGASDAFDEAIDIREYNKKVLWDGINRPGGLQQVGLERVADPVFEGYMFDREVAEILNRVVTVVDGDEGTLAITRALRGYSSWWKSVVTTSPGFHFRNMYSNNITQFLRFGMDAFNPEYTLPALLGAVKALHGEAGLELARKSLGSATVQRMLAKEFGGYSTDQLASMAVRSGVISKHVMAGSQEQTIAKLAGTAETSLLQKANPFGKEFVPYRFSQEVGAVVESVPRFQSFIMDIAKMNRKPGQRATSGQLEWAKIQAKKWFLDYTDLTDFEQRIMKNFIPFYSWLRKNLTNQIQGIIEAPQMYAIIPKAQAAAQGDLGVDRQILPAWMQQLGMFPIEERDDGSALMFRPNFPYQDLNILPVQFEGGENQALGLIPAPRLQFNEFLFDIANAAHPTVKSLVGVVTGQDIFRREELREDAPAPRALRLLTKSKGLLAFLDGALRMAVPGSDGLHLNEDDRGRLTMDPQIAYVLENNVPVLKRLAEFMDVPVFFAEQMGIPMEAMIERMTGAVDDYDGLEEGLQLLSQNLGVKMKVLDRERAQLNRAYETYKEAQDERRSANRSRPGFQRRSLQAKQRQRNTFRRFSLIK